jgi:hypothetical protein
MDGVLSDGRKGKLFFCRRHDGHALGIVLDKQLLLFRHALVLSHAIYDKVGVVEIAPRSIIGRPKLMDDIECDCCGATRTWKQEGLAEDILGALYGKEKAQDDNGN